ncbi:MAG: protein phosphatase 2C domain-containing protein [Clostridiales bacterium]
MDYQMTQQGVAHGRRDISCQDYITHRSLGDSQFFYILLDGMGGYENSGDFVKHFSLEISKFLEENFQRLFELSNNQIRKEILEFVIKAQKNFESATQCAAESYGSTFIALLKNGNDLLVLHQGDGAVIGIPNSACAKANIISYPENFECESKTISITIRSSQDPNSVISHLRVLHLKTEDYNSIIIGSDGGVAPLISMSEFASDAAYSIVSMAIGGKLTPKQIVEELHIKKDVTDDISFIVVDLKDENKADCEQSLLADNTQPLSLKDGQPMGEQRRTYVGKGKKARQYKIDIKKIVNKCILPLCIIGLIATSVLSIVEVQNIKSALEENEKGVSELRDTASFLQNKIRLLEKSEADERAQTTEEAKTKENPIEEDSVSDVNGFTAR